MTVKIHPYERNHHPFTVTEGLLTLGDSGCLPKIIADTFGWEAIQIECTDDKEESKSFGACRIGRKIVLLPHFSYGPFSAPGTVESIFDELKKQGYTCEWRLFEKASEFAFTDKVSSFLPLQTSSDLQFQLLNANLRRKIRKGSLNGITIKSGKSELLHNFYEIYSRNMHRLGSPALSKRWFMNILDQYRDGKAGIWCAYLNDKPVGVAFMIEFKGFYEACWFSTLRKYNKFYPSYALYWEMICHAIEHKGLHFSFGRSSPDSGVHKFKQQWGGVDFPLVWNYSHPQGKNIRSFTFLTKLWKIMPYRLARFLGPFVAGRLY